MCTVEAWWHSGWVVSRNALVICMPILMSATKCPQAFLLNFTITSGKNYVQ